MKFDIFAPEKYKKYADAEIAKQYMRTDVQIITVDGGVIALDGRTPPYGQGAATGQNTHSTAYGIFDADGNFVKESLQYHKRKAQYIPKNQNGDIPYMDETVIYIGNINPHFGHFLLKHLNRAWALKDDKYRDAKVVLINDRYVNPIPKFVYDFIKMLGMELILVDRTTRFKRIYVPSQTFNFYTYWAPEFPRSYEYIAARQDGKQYDKIYLSRAKMNVRAPFGEKKIQNIFEKNGFHIVYPETLSLSEQISLMKNCRVLAGCGGTALHLALFMPRGGTVIQLKRNKMYDDNITMQHAISLAKDLDLFCVWASVEKTKTEWLSDIPQIIGGTKYLKQFFDKFEYVYDADDLILDSEEVKEYNRQRKSVVLKVWIHKLKRRFIHFTAAFIPFRKMRIKYCEKMKRIL